MALQEQLRSDPADLYTALCRPSHMLMVRVVKCIIAFGLKSEVLQPYAVAIAAHVACNISGAPCTVRLQLQNTVVQIDLLLGNFGTPSAFAVGIPSMLRRIHVCSVLIRVSNHLDALRPQNVIELCKHG